ncbi:radical S-adenosyl methionine domain-containing protein 1 [Mortierella sp. AM989]|nr:radical S-adenosyl methionine domain-containing protein 1 [Mortierella sp. AM989]
MLANLRFFSTLRPLSKVVEPEPFSIYIHWPYCSSKCTYCNFNKYVDPNIDHERMERSLITELETELAFWGLDQKTRPVRSVYFGGGTPSLAKPSMFLTILNTLDRVCGLTNHTEITMEGNPSSTTSVKTLKLLRDIGINRYSLGVQSFQNRILTELGRDHTPSSALRSLLDARSVWPGKVSMDLIMGHSGQTLADWKRELRFTLDVVDDHLSLYHLTAEPGTALYRDVAQGSITLPDSELAADMYEAMIEMTEEAGFEHYEVSNFARNYAYSQHNSGHWHGVEYLGIGPGAHGRVRDPKSRKHIRTFNIRDPAGWMQQCTESGTGRTVAIDLEETMQELVALGMRTKKGVELERFKKLTGQDLREVSPKKRAADGTGFVAPSLKKSKSSGSLLDLSLATPASNPGRVYVFGTGDCAQLGLGEDVLLRKKPANLTVLNDKNIVDIAAGGMHNMALTQEGKLWSWGVNDQRTLGRSGDEYTPMPVEGLEDVKIVKVACSDSLTVALTDDGQVYTWGTFRSAEGILGHSKEKEVQELPTIVQGLKGIVDIATGTDHVLALASTGRVFSWGNGQQMQLGRRIVARRMLNGLTPESIGAKKGLIKVGAGSYHSFAIDKNGKALAWGLNTYGQCGNDDPNKDNIPTVAPISALKDHDFADIQGGEHHTIALTKDGNLYGFGRSDSHQLGLGYTEEPGLEDSSSHKKAIRHPTLIPGLPSIQSISVGGNHTLALSKDGDVYAWGFGEMLACGNGLEVDVEKPLKLTGQQIENRRILKVAAGGQHSVILVSKEQ